MFIDGNTLSLRQLLAGLLRYHVGGVPVGPVCVVLPDVLFMLTVGRRRSAKCASQIVHRGKRSLGLFDAAGQPCRDLLQQP